MSERIGAAVMTLYQYEQSNLVMARARLAGVWADLYACQHCDGRGYMPDGEQCYTGHVELSNPFDQSVVYADPALCERKCFGYRHPADSRGAKRCLAVHGEDRFPCGWRPVPIQDLP
jgi:hypothetical protein